MGKFSVKSMIQEYKPLWNTWTGRTNIIKTEVNTTEEKKVTVKAKIVLFSLFQNNQDLFKCTMEGKTTPCSKITQQ